MVHEREKAPCVEITGGFVVWRLELRVWQGVSIPLPLKMCFYQGFGERKGNGNKKIIRFYYYSEV